MQHYFSGWYLKTQSDTQALALIPAFHEAGGERTCSIQIITEEDAWAVTYPIETYHHADGDICIGKNRFGRHGVRLSVNTSAISARGTLQFGSFTPLKYDIMGPFAFIPCMECRHSVFSMRHVVNGTVMINGQQYIFHNAVGYWEGDRGRSFPKEYLWTQCSFKEGSIMLSVADIPLAGMHFAGIIGVVFLQEKEHRFATYLGAKVIRLEKGMVRIRQGDMELEVRLLESASKALKAPAKGKMTRMIRESVACHAYYKFKKCGAIVFEFETRRASFEYEYRR